MRTPSRTKSYDSFASLSGSGVSSGHKTTLFSKVRKEKTRGADYLWQHKQFVHADLAEIEAAMAGLYALIEPDRIPKVRAIYENNSAESFATISKIFPNFIDLQSFLENGINDGKMNQLIEMGFAEVLTLSYFFEEDDLHKENIGFSDKKVVRVDFDMSAYSMISRADLRGQRDYAYSSKTPEDAFRITANDLNQFPRLVDADPSYFPTKSRALSASHGYSAHEMSVFLKLTYDHRFIHNCYQTLMKIVLMPDNSFEKTIASFMPSGANRKDFQDHFIARKMKLKEELIKTPRFRFFWEKFHELAIKKIIDDVRKYNETFKEERAHLGVDLNELKKNYDVMCEDMLKISGVPVSQVDELAQDLIVWLKQDENIKRTIPLLVSIVTECENLSVGYVSWIWSSQPAGLPDIKRIMGQLSESTPAEEFLRKISQLLSLQADVARKIGKEFLVKLIPLFSPEKTQETDMQKLTAALVVAMQPIAREEVDGFTLVEHSSDHFESGRLNGSFTRPQ